MCRTWVNSDGVGRGKVLFLMHPTARLSPRIPSTPTCVRFSQELLDHNHALRAYRKVLEGDRKLVGQQLYGRVDQLVEQMSRIFKSTATTPSLFVPLLLAHLTHISGDHTLCPTLDSVGEGQRHDGAIFHCPLACTCTNCIPKKEKKDLAEAAPGPKKARDTQVYGGVIVPRCASPL